uniref:Uncharacterized protein n=1 Tax=Cyprinus carpio TaxID=7962 RepID=A0A8C1ZQC2_CYPCA
MVPLNVLHVWITYIENQMFRVDVSLDRSCVQNYSASSLSSIELCKFMSDLSLIDVYRIFYPAKRHEQSPGAI